MKLEVDRYEPTGDELASEGLLYEREPVGRGPLEQLLVLRIRHKMLLAEYAALVKDVEIKTDELLRNLRGASKSPKVASRKW